MSDVDFGLIQLCLHDEMVAVSEKSEAPEKSAEKGSAMTKNRDGGHLLHFRCDRRHLFW